MASRSRSGPEELSDDEQKVFTAVSDLEVTTGNPPALLEVAQRSGMTTERARVVLSSLTGDLGLVTQLPGTDVDWPVYTPSGRAGSGRPVEQRRLGDIDVEVTRALAGVHFPATKALVVEAASRAGVPGPLRIALEDLPDDAAYRNLEDLSEALRAQLG